MNKVWSKLDKPLLIIMILFFSFGLMMVFSSSSIVSVVGLGINKETKEKVINELDRKSLKFNNLRFTDMNVSFEVEEQDLKHTVRCIHDLFFANRRHF